jgi:formyl-CoA transferase
MSLTGAQGQGPMRVGIPIADLCSGHMLAQGILVALYERQQTGKGAWVQTSLLEAQIAMLDFQASRWLMKKEVAGQEGNNHPTITPVGMFETSDGHINLGGAGQKLFERLCNALGAPELIGDPRFKTNVDRTQHRSELNKIVGELCLQWKSAELVEMLNAAGVPAGPINSVDKVFQDPQVQYLGMAQSVDHPRLGNLHLVAQPTTLTGHMRSIVSAAPELGQHTAEILAEIGYSELEVEEFLEQSVVTTAEY